MAVIIAKLDILRKAESTLYNNYNQYLSLLQSSEKYLNSLSGWKGAWNGLDNSTMNTQTQSGIADIKKQGEKLKAQADYIYRWRTNIEYAQGVMSNYIKGIGW